MKSYKMFLLFLVVSPISYAAKDNNDFNVDLSVTSQLSDNGGKHIIDNLGLEEKERQDIYSVGSDFQWSNQWADFKGRYSIERWLYSKNSQPDYDSINGDAKLNIGSEYQLAHLEVTQSNKSLLVAPDALDISSNRDQRSITTVEPSLRWGFGEVNKINASLSASGIKYGKQAFAESTLKGAQVIWVHEVSQIDRLRFIVQSNKAEFEFKPSLDYRLDALSLAYSVNLKHFSYGISVGENRATEYGSGEEFNRPNFNINADYDSAIYTFKLLFSERISNSSAGDGNSEGFVGSNLDSMNAGLDLINIKSGGLSFSSSILCDRCKLSLAVEKNQEEYKTLQEDSNLGKIRSGFTYAIGRKGSLDVSYSELKRTFASQINRNYLRHEYEASYVYDFMKNAHMKLFYRKYLNDSDLSYNKYEENIAGLVVGYSL